MIGTLFGVELLKIKRSLVAAMTLVCPLAVVVLVFAISLYTLAPEEVDGVRLSRMWLGVTAMWSAFMLPLYLALATSLINGNEHRNQTWRLMLSLPVDVGALYTAKLLVAICLMLCAHVVLLGATALMLGVLGLAGYAIDGAFALPSNRVLWAPLVTALPVLLIQHAVSWHLRSIVAPLSLAAVGTFVGMQIANSTRWVWWPWAYPLVSTNATDADAQALAVVVAPVLAVVLYVTSLWLARRREFV